MEEKVMDSGINIGHDLAGASSKDNMIRCIDFFRNNDMLNQFFKSKY